jgi:hypothetical protein
MANSNTRPDEYRQGEEQYMGTPRNENYASACGGYAPSNSAQSGVGGDRYYQGNDERYASRHEYNGPTAYGGNESRYGGSPRSMSQRFGGYDGPRQVHSGYSNAERNAQNRGGYGPDAGDPYWRPHHGVFEFGNEDFSPYWQIQGYPNLSHQFHGGMNREGYRGGHARDFGDNEGNAGEGYRGGYGSGRQGTSGGISDYYGHSHHVDPDYHQWREEQIKNLDRDYHGWRQQRYQKFSEDFNNWRSTRPSPDQSQSHEPANATDNSGTGSSASHSSKSSSSKS